MTSGHKAFVIIFPVSNVERGSLSHVIQYITVLLNWITELNSAINNCIGSHAACRAADCSTCRGLPRPLWSLFLSLPGTSPQYNSCTRLPLGSLLSVCHFVPYGYITILLGFEIMSWFYYSEELSAFRFCVSFARITQNERIIPVFFRVFYIRNCCKDFDHFGCWGTTVNIVEQV
jgi:hypothetical protein